MKNISTGAGLAILGLGIAAHPILSNFGSSAAASASTAPIAAAVAATANAQSGPTVVWMGVTTFVSGYWVYHRLWSDGRLETRTVTFNQGGSGCGIDLIPSPCSTYNWREVPPPAGGNGFACRTDIDGDRKVDGNDLASVLNAWGQQGGCEPEATYPCLSLGNLAGGAATK